MSAAPSASDDIIAALDYAILEGNLVNLRALLSPENNASSQNGVGGGGRRGRLAAAAARVTDEDIDEALLAAAEKGCVESCRLLWQRLSRTGKKKYCAVRRSQRHN